MPPFPGDDAAPSSDVMQRFGAAFASARAEGAGFSDALERAAAAELAAWGDHRPMTNTVAHLALAFERTSGASVQADQMVIVRIASAYYLAVDRIAEKGETEVNLPFLTATSSGPLHFQQMVTAADLARMSAQRPDPAARPAPAAAAPAPEPEPEPPKKKKRGWLW